MKKILLSIIIILLLCSVSIIPQQKAVLRQDGSIEYLNKRNKEVIPLSKVPTDYALRKKSGEKSIKDVDDTLGYGHLFPTNGTNFGFFGQDRMIMWFKAPADMIIHAAGFNTYPEEGNPDNQECRLKLVWFAWNMDSINTQAAEERLGYYESITGGGYYPWTAYLDDPDRTGGWISINGQTSPFGHDLWSDYGLGVLVIPDDDLPVTEYQWVDMDELGFEPQVLRGSIVGLSMKNDYPFSNGPRVGFWSHIASNIGMPPTYKFYNTDYDRDVGWWSRDYTWDFVLAVTITGDVPPSINSYTIIPSGIVGGPFLIDANITDLNPGDTTNAGVASASIFFSIDSGMVWTEIPMSGSEPDFTGEIPAQSPGSTVHYKIQAIDINGNLASTPVTTFYIFAPSGAKTLIVFNGFDSPDGYPLDFYWGPEIKDNSKYFAHDIWKYGELPENLLNHYTNVIEICSGSPDYFTDQEIRPWLEANGNRNYFLASEEWLEDHPRYPEIHYVSGEFEYDILGLYTLFADISYDGTSGQQLPTSLYPIEGTRFGQPLKEAFIESEADSLMYNPMFVLGENNWQDAFELLDNNDAEMNVETRGIGGVPDVQILPTMLSRTLPAGNKIVFCGFDPLALTTALDSNYSYYSWIGYDERNVTYQTLVWFGIDILTDSRDAEYDRPLEFSLIQNYPNPFNPATKISWQSPIGGQLSLKVFDVLGKEVATLVDEFKPAGKCEVEFDASALPSGIYFYQLKVYPANGGAGAFIQTKKMVLLK